MEVREILLQNSDVDFRGAYPDCIFKRCELKTMRFESEQNAGLRQNPQIKSVALLFFLMKT